MQPKISIITIAYNSAATIEETIRSVVSQDYPHVEYIIIDGGSTDGTLDIVNRYRDHIATVVSEPDHGISDAFNKGIARATGQMIALINSDDHLLPGALTRVAATYDGETEIYGGNVLLWDPETDYKCREVPSTHFPVMPFFCHVAHQGMFATPECYRRIGGYDTQIRYPMDLEFLVRATRLHARFKHIDVDVAEFRSGGATGANSILRKRRDYVYLVRKNGGNILQAYAFYSFLVATQGVKAILSLFGRNLGQRLRYKRAAK